MAEPEPLASRVAAYIAEHALLEPGEPVLALVSGGADSACAWGVVRELGYDDGRAATLLGTLRHQTPGAARIFGTEGFIEIPPRFHHPDRIVLHRAGAEPEEFLRPPQGAGYSHELVEVSECLREGRTESSVMPLTDTLAVQRILNEASERLGVVHREDATVEV